MNYGEIGNHEGGVTPSVEEKRDDMGEKLVSGLNLMANVSLKLGKAVDDVTRQVTDLSRKLYNAPSSYHAVGSASAITFQGVSNSYLLNLGSPDQGTYWEINNMLAGFSSWTNDEANTISANQLFVLVSPSVLTSSIAPQHIVYAVEQAYDGSSGTTSVPLPWADTFGTRNIVVNDQENLLILATNVQNSGSGLSTQMIGSARVTVYNVALGAGNVEITA